MPVLLRPIKPKKEEKVKYKGYKGISLVVYSDVYFYLFFARHCTRRHQQLSEFTVVVVGEEGFPSEKDIKAEIEKILTKKIKLKKGTMFEKLSAPYFARIWSLRKGQFSDELPSKAILRFEDCQKASYADLEMKRNQGIVTQADIDSVREIRRNAEKNKLFIRAAWLIGHIDVIKIK